MPSDQEKCRPTTCALDSTNRGRLDLNALNKPPHVPLYDPRFAVVDGGGGDVRPRNKHQAAGVVYLSVFLSQLISCCL